MKLSHVNIPKCLDGNYYTGANANLEQRILDYKAAKDPDSYTAKRRPLELVFYAEFTDINIAISKEKQIKKLVES
jgi:putative endonuclease